MSAPAQVDFEPRTVEEFLAMYDGAPGLNEFVDGKVITSTMTNNTFAHGEMLLKLGAALLPLADRFSVVAEGEVRTSRSIRFADLLVVQNRTDPKTRHTSVPIVTVEVLSPTTADQDFGPKVREYLEFESLQHYLIVSEAQPEAWLWSRNEEGKWPASSVVLEGESVLELDAVDLLIPLASLH